MLEFTVEDTPPSIFVNYVVPDDRADDLIDAVGALLEERAGVMFVSETAVGRPGYFGQG